MSYLLHPEVTGFETGESFSIIHNFTLRVNVRKSVCLFRKRTDSRPSAVVLQFAIPYDQFYRNGRSRVVSSQIMERLCKNSFS